MADDTPPEGEEEKAIWTICRVVKAATGQVLSEAEARVIFEKAKERMIDAMAQANVEQP